MCDYMPQTIETLFHFSFDNKIIIKRQLRQFRLISIHHLISVKLICTGLKMSPVSAAKLIVQGSTEEIVEPLNHGSIPILCPSPVLILSVKHYAPLHVLKSTQLFWASFVVCGGSVINGAYPV